MTKFADPKTVKEFLRVHGVSNEGKRSLVDYIENPPIRCSYQSCFFYHVLNDNRYNIEEHHCGLMGSPPCGKEFFLKRLLEYL